MLFLDDTVRDLCGELEVSEDQIIDLSMVKELAVVMLLEARAHAQLAQDPDTVVVDDTTVDPRTGKFGKSRKTNPLHLALEKLRKRKQRLMDALVATREAKARDKSRRVMDPSQIAGQMARRLQEMAARQRLQQTQEEVDGSRFRVTVMPDKPAE